MKWFFVVVTNRVQLCSTSVNKRKVSVEFIGNVEAISTSISSHLKPISNSPRIKSSGARFIVLCTWQTCCGRAKASLRFASNVLISSLAGISQAAMSERNRSAINKTTASNAISGSRPESTAQSQSDNN